KTYSTTSQITLVPNPRYWGARKAAFKTVVIRNMIAPTQLINIQRGTHEVAIDLSADQAQSIRGNTKLKVSLQPSTWIFWLFASLAQKVQANLQAAGFKIELAGSPVGTWLQKYRDGKMAFGLSLWGPDYPDPADYLAFTPGQLVGVRAGWPAGSDAAIEKLAAQAQVTTATKARESVYRQIQLQLNQRGPF